MFLKMLWATLAVLVIWASVIVVKGGGISTPAAPPLTAEQQKANDEETTRVVIAANMAKGLKHALRDPESLKLSSVLIMDSHAVCYEFRARNGFSGTNLAQAVLSPKGRFLTSEQDGFSVLWNRLCAGKTGTDETFRVTFILDHLS